MTGKKKKSGIRRRYLKYTIALLLMALLLSSLGVGVYAKEQMTSAIIDKYEFMTERMGIALDNLYGQSDETTTLCILNEDVQKTLQNQGLEEVRHIALSKYFAYVPLEGIADYCYVDNKGNVYSRSYSNVSYENVKESGFREHLGEEYSCTKWFWAKDTLFGTGQEALFIGRYVRSLDYSHEPGMLFFKMEESFLEEVVGMSHNLKDEAVIGIADRSGQICLFSAPERIQVEQNQSTNILERITGNREPGMFLTGAQVPGGILSAYCQEDSGMVIFSFVPNSVLNRGIFPVFLVLAGIYLLVIAVAVILSIYFSRRFTRPVQILSQAMTGFDGTSFDYTIELHTHTELDVIGSSYNKMLYNIQRLLEEIKEQERELRTTELNMLISQINPHFLYNTLDTIYMLARINREETTMKMIQALSRYLRLSLSKGSEIVTLADELENVKSYMEIQQIRNENLFSYQVDCRVDASETWVLKLILQPLVENAVKYGFRDIYEGGYIRITAEYEAAMLCLRVYNSGLPIEREMLEKINRMNALPLSQLKDCFPDKKRGYGVVNILTRLRLKYGDGVIFYYEAVEEGTICTIKIPGGGKKEAYEA